MNRRSFIQSMIKAGVACAFLPGAGRIWAPEYSALARGRLNAATLYYETIFNAVYLGCPYPKEDSINPLALKLRNQTIHDCLQHPDIQHWIYRGSQNPPKDPRYNESLVLLSEINVKLDQ